MARPTAPPLTRRDFVATTAALSAAALARVPGRRTPSAAGLVVLFQGDSITDAGRDRQVSEPNLARGLGDGYPLLVAAAALAAHPDGALRFYNRGVSGDKVPDLTSRWATPQYWAADGVHPTPAGHALIAEQWRRAAHL